MKNKEISRKTFIKTATASATLAAASTIPNWVKSAAYAQSGNDDMPDSLIQKKPISAKPPNVIIINADDLGYGDLGCYGSDIIKTPNIDSLASNGVRFTDFHACDSVCSPSRAGLLTGRYPKRMGLDVPLQPKGFIMNMVMTFWYTLGKTGLIDLASSSGASAIDQNEITLAEALKIRHYRTGMVGKWHLGDYAQNLSNNPIEHGFDFYFGVPYSNDMYPLPLYRNEEELESNISDQSKLTGQYTKEAIRFIESNQQDPFFLYFAHTFPHRPLHRSQDFINKSEGGKYGDTVEELDWSVGEILKTLKDRGLDQNTIIFFTSDNGPWYQGSPGQFRGRKGQSFEGGHRVPFLAQWTDQIAPGSVCDAAAMNIDLFPTLLSLAGLTLPTDRIIDGKDLSTLLTGQTNKSPHDALYFYHHGTLEGIRSENWKYVRSINHYVWPSPVNKTIGNWSKHIEGPLPLLFNLEKDHGEAYDVLEKYPGVGERLLNQMVHWEKAMESNPGGWITAKNIVGDRQ